jgi:hypothetical protein
MAISLKPAQGVSVTVATAGTAVAPSVALPDNCHTLIVYNTSAAATAYLQFVPTAGAFATASAVVIPPQASITLALGTLSQRPGSGAGGIPDSLFFDASVNATVVRVTYVNGVSV